MHLCFYVHINLPFICRRWLCVHFSFWVMLVEKKQRPFSRRNITVVSLFSTFGARTLVIWSALDCRFEFAPQKFKLCPNDHATLTESFSFSSEWFLNWHLSDTALLPFMGNPEVESILTVRKIVFRTVFFISFLDCICDLYINHDRGLTRSAITSQMSTAIQSSRKVNCHKDGVKIYEDAPRFQFAL